MSRTPQKRPFRKSFFANLLLIFLLCIGLYWLFFASLGWITGHGKEKTVPQLVGKSWQEAQKLLNTQGFEVDVDSAYDPNQKVQTVMQQQPDSGMTVKEGRTIFLIINKVSPPQTPMPNLINLSFRSADLLLRSSKLVLGDTLYKPDIAVGSVLAQQWSNGQDIKPGTMIPQGSVINLVIGDGLGDKEIPVPDVTGMNYLEAIAILSVNNLQYTVIFDGPITDTTTAVVSGQMPAITESETVRLMEGDFVDLRVRQTLALSADGK